MIINSPELRQGVLITSTSCSLTVLENSEQLARGSHFVKQDLNNYMPEMRVMLREQSFENDLNLLHTAV